MYPYHNRIIQRIKNGELIEIVENYLHPSIGICILFVFNTPPYTRPIRFHSVHIYKNVLENYPIKKDT
jgi:hypothetical protein